MKKNIPETQIKLHEETRIELNALPIDPSSCVLAEHSSKISKKAKTITKRNRVAKAKITAGDEEAALFAKNLISVKLSKEIGD